MARWAFGISLMVLSLFLFCVMLAELFPLRKKGGSVPLESSQTTRRDSWWLQYVSEEYRCYFEARSNYTMAAYAFSLLFAESLGRVLNAFWGLMDRHRKGREGLPGGPGETHHAYHECATALTLSCIASVVLVSAWALKLRHKYYVVLRKTNWSKIMDDSPTDSLSFWIKYKAFLTSDVVVVALVLTYVVVVGIITVRNRERHHVTSILNISSTAFCCLLAQALVFGVPKSNCLKRKEVSILSALMLSAMTIESIGLLTIRDWHLEYALSELCSTVMVFAMWNVSFCWLPQVCAKNQHMCRFDHGDTETLFGKLQSVLCDVEKVADFMDYCCEHMCAENVVALLEIKEFKTQLRKMLESSGIGLKPTRSGSKPVHSLSPPPVLSNCPSDSSSRVRVQLGLMEHMSSASSSTPLATCPSHEKRHSMRHCTLFSIAKQSTALELAAYISEDWTTWDMTFCVNLSKLGCHSKIVKGSGDARSKAQALCEKYFAWDSEFALTVSSENRNKVLKNVGKTATVDLEPSLLLFVFDEVVSDIFDNLYDAAHSFARRKS